MFSRVYKNNSRHNSILSNDIQDYGTEEDNGDAASIPAVQNFAVDDVHRNGSHSASWEHLAEPSGKGQAPRNQNKAGDAGDQQADDCSDSAELPLDDLPSNNFAHILLILHTCTCTSMHTWCDGNLW